MNVRSLNLLGEYLVGSKCSFIFKRNIDLNEIELDPNFKLKGLGELKELSYPHEFGDAFTGIFYLSNLLREKILALDSADLMPVDFKVDAFKVKHFYCNSEQTQNRLSARSFLKSYLSRPNRLLDSQNLSFVVCMDNVAELNKENIKGNSFVIVETPTQKVREMLSASSLEWKAGFLKKAKIIFQWLSKGRDLKVESQTPLLISSLGDISRFSYTHSELRPSKLAMIPTPNKKSKAHLVMWSYAFEHALSIVADPEHAIWQECEEIEGLWRSLLLEKKQATAVVGPI